MKIENIIDTYITRWICVFGILGNVVNLFVLTRKSVFGHMSKLEKSSHVFFTALAMSDLLYCTGSFPETFKAFKGKSGPGMNFWVLYDAYGYAVINCFLLTSTWLIVAMAVHRYVAICRLGRARQYLSVSLSRAIIMAIFCLSILFILPRIWMHKIESEKCEEGGELYYVMNSFMKKNETASMTYALLNFILGILMPLLVLIYCNVFLVKALHASSDFQQQHATRRGAETTHVATLTMCIIVILYIVLVGPAELVTFWRPFVSRANAAQYGLAVKICNALQMLNFAINFILYCVINVHFRKVMKSVICCQHPRLRAILCRSTRKNGTTAENTMMLSSLRSTTFSIRSVSSLVRKK